MSKLTDLLENTSWIWKPWRMAWNSWFTRSLHWGWESFSKKKEKTFCGFMKGKKWRTSIKFSSNLVASYSVVAMSGWLPRLSFCKCRNHEGRTNWGVYKKSKNLYFMVCKMYNFTKIKELTITEKTGKKIFIYVQKLPKL